MQNIIPLNVMAPAPLPAEDKKKKLGLSEATWSYRFKFEGKVYTLTKRNKTRDGVWNLETMIRGKEIRRSLDTNDSKTAADRAINDYIRPAKAGQWTAVEAKKLRTDFSTIGQVFEAYQLFSKNEIEPSTVKHNLKSFRIVVRRGLGNDEMTSEKVEALSTAVLTGKLISAFEEFSKAAAVNVETNKRSMAGYLRQARSIFKRRFIPKYRELGLALPLADLTDWLTRQTAKPAKKTKRLRDDALLTATFAAVEKFKAEDRPAYMGWLLGLSSLRRREAAFAKWNWVIRSEGQPYIVVPAEIAKSGDDRAVKIDERVFQELQDFRAALDAEGTGLTDSTDYILPAKQMSGVLQMRCHKLFRRVSAWMRGLGWTTRFTMHEMRAYALQHVDEHYGLGAAQSQGGHADQKTTEIYIGTRKNRDVVINLPLTIAGKPAAIAR